LEGLIVEPTRRKFVLMAGGLGLVGVGAMTPASPEGARERKQADTSAKKKREGEGSTQEDISPPEDLMREHGVLNRILLIYEEGLRRLRTNQEVPPEVFRRTANLVRRFVEDYHERLEENFIFPRFERASQLTDLVRVLRQQHQAGRAVTDVILRNAARDQFRLAECRAELVRACEAFIRMYRPHEAREDTVLFPALHRLVPAREMRELGERFEHEEDRLFGEGGFQRIVGQVAEIERQLGIYDLAQFTPQIRGQ
jgi:hemerythrin-like domain-containing protein